MYTYEIDQTLLPTVYVSWATTKNKQFDKHYFLCCQTGIKKDTPEDWMQYKTNSDGTIRFSWRDTNLGAYKFRGYNLDKIWVDNGDQIIYAYFKWHEDIQKLEVAAVKMDTSRKTQPRQWEYAGDRWFVGKDKSVVDVNGNAQINTFHVFQHHDAYSFKNALSMLTRLSPCLNWKEQAILLIGSDTYTTIGGRTEAVMYMWQLQYWLTHKLKTVKNDKTQDFVSRLTSMPLANYQVCTDAANLRYYWQKSNQAYYCKIDDNWSCLRFIVMSHPDAGGEMHEYGRMYFSEDGKNQYVVKVDGVWAPSRHPTDCSAYFVNPAEAIAQSRRAKYIIESVGTDKPAETTSVFMATLRRPELEQAIKIGLKSTVTAISRSHTVAAEIKHKFGYYDPKQSTFLKQVGLTKKQVDIVESYRNMYYNSSYGAPMKIMRNIFGDDLSPINCDLFESYLREAREMSRSWSLRRAIDDNIVEDMPRFLKNLMRLGKTDKSIYNIAGDALNAYRAIDADARPTINWIFEDRAEAARVHDALDTLRRQQYSMSQAQRLQRNAAQCAKIDEERKVYEYEDEQFIIRLPKTLMEIVEEGQKQRICIGGYAETHAKGNTNLFLLRKKSEPDEPFFAIEMKNDKHIQQIHGKCNKWLGCNPEAVPTVMRWLRKNGIRCDTKILTCTATGYGRTNTYIELPNID